jgi:lipid-A-disaccharide synthase
MASTTRLMMVAGEASGDRHGAHLVAALREQAPFPCEFFGAGGAEMRAAGVETLVDIRELAIMGLPEIARALPNFWRVFRRLRAAAQERQPSLIILVDWPEFNLRLAKALHRDGHRVIYFISPQVWAWRTYRIRSIRRTIERMLVILPFEKDFYERHGMEVDFVGHPLQDSLHLTEDRAAFCQRHGLDADRPVLAFLPGSRHSELRSILPPLLGTIKALHDRHPDWQAVLPLAPTVGREAIPPLPGLRVVEGETTNAVAAADLAIVASGTATLETALLGTPLLIVYRASALNWHLLHPMIQVPYVGLPNLIAGRKIVPELLQNGLTVERLVGEIEALLGNPSRMEMMRQDLAEVREALGPPGASARAAERILGLLAEPPRDLG